MAEKYYSSLEVARMLDINPSRLARAVWVEKIPQPAKSPGGKGVFLWVRDDVERASQLFRKRDASDIFDQSLPQLVQAELKETESFLGVGTCV